MVFSQCDSCGKTLVVKNNTTEPNLYYFQDLDICSDCYPKLEEIFMQHLKKTGNDMKAYLSGLSEVAHSFAKNKKKK